MSATARKPLVIVESPFAAKGWWLLRAWRQRQNIRYARACVRDSVLRGEAPIASHLLFTQPGILRDGEPEERQLGIDAGLAWRSVAEFSVVYLDRGVSSGMKYGIAAAEAAGLPVKYRHLRKMDNRDSGCNPRHDLANMSETIVNHRRQHDDGATQCRSNPPRENFGTVSRKVLHP